ncbi:hypothetical protein RCSIMONEHASTD_59 [Rhodobacter phage RcSimone-Hastad]|jgi:hypothetical protein|nr:hypothetical protein RCSIMONEHASTD_59 [Rhodobacter phage RcSimone-Hastad]
MTLKNDPQGAFIGNVARAVALLEALKSHFDDHMEVNPDEVHWGHVGTAGKACEDLEELCRFVGVKV